MRQFRVVFRLDAHIMDVTACAVNIRIGGYTMNEEARKARSAYLRQWRAKNREKIKRYTDTYWTKKAVQMALKKQLEATGGGEKFGSK